MKFVNPNCFKVISLAFILFMAVGWHARAQCNLNCFMDNNTTNVSLAKCMDIPAFTNEPDESFFRYYLHQEQVTDFSWGNIVDYTSSPEEANIYQTGEVHTTISQVYTATQTMNIPNSLQCTNTTAVTGSSILTQSAHDTSWRFDEDGSWTNYFFTNSVVENESDTSPNRVDYIYEYWDSVGTGRSDYENTTTGSNVTGFLNFEAIAVESVSKTPTIKTVIAPDDYRQDYYSADTITTVSREYDNALLYANILSLISGMPTNGGSGYAQSTIDDPQVNGSLQKMQYRFKIPPQTQTNTTYHLTWDVITKSQYNGDTNFITIVDTNNYEDLKGTGDPVNFVYGSVHTIEAPQFYCSKTKGGTCTKYVANLMITILSDGGAPGSGPYNLPTTPGSTCGSCSASAGAGHDGGMQAEFSLGNAALGQPAGRLRIWAALPSPSLATPGNLMLSGTNGETVVIYTNDRLRQVFAPQTLADIIVSNDFSYQINFYYPTNVGTFDGSLYPVSGSPYVSWNVSNPNGTNSMDTLLITETRGSATWNYAYVYATNNNSWTYILPGGLAQTQLITSNGIADNTRTLYSITAQTNGTPAKIFSRTYQEFSWGEGVVSETDGSGSSARTTTMTYYDSGYAANGTFVPLKQVVRPDGSWEYYEYTTLADGINVPYDTYAGVGDSQANSSTGTGDYRRTVYSYSSLGDDDGTQLPYTPRSTVQSLSTGGEVSRTFLVMLPGERQDIRCVRAGANYDDGDNLVTITKYFTSGPNINRVQSIQNPDGTMSFYDYASSADGWQTNTVSTGQPNGGATAIADGTQTVTILDTFGKTVSTTTKDIVSGATLYHDVYGDFDPLDRAQVLTHLDGTSNTFDYACCFLDSTVDSDGVLTHYLHDDAKRSYGYQKFYTANDTNYIAYQNTLDAAGRVTQSQRYGINAVGSSTIVQSQSGYDLVGRLLTRTNALGGVTSYVETNDPITGAYIYITTYADGGTLIETNYTDGTLKSRTGTAVHGVRYEYGAENDDLGHACSFTKEIKLLNNGSDSSEWTKTYTDMAGRTTETLYADGSYSRSYYNPLGQLTNTVDPDGVSTIYTYNAKGERAWTVADMNQDGIIDAGSTGHDRITQTTNDVTADHGTTVNRSRTFVWLDGSSSGTLASCTETSANGLDTWQTRYSDGGVSVTTHSHTVPGVSRTVTTTNADNSYIINAYSYGRLQTATRYDSGHVQLSSTSYTYDAHGRQQTATDARNGTTTYGYNSADQVASVAAPLSETTYTYYDLMLRATNVVQPDGNPVYSSYLLTGELGLQHGSRTYPVAYTYDYAGRMQTMTTWTDYLHNSGTNTTTWLYDGNRGWLTNKMYADGKGPSYAYTFAGRLASRTWVRGITTGYSYDASGSLTNIAYSDDTPSVTNTFDRLGRQVKTEWGTNVECMRYDLVGDLINDSFPAGILAGLTVTNHYDSDLRRDNLSALSGPSVTLSSTTYAYDNASRLSIVTDDLNNNSVGYSYLADSSLISQIGFTNGTTQRMLTTKTYDHLNRLTEISSQPSASGLAPIAFNYSYNQANQRTKNTLADGSYWAYSYDALGQVVGGNKYFADGTAVPGQQFGYGFDDIGNRKQTTVSGNGEIRIANYSVNSLNQITSRDYPGTNDVIGVGLATNAVSVNGQTAWRKGEYFWSTVKSNNTAAVKWEGVRVGGGSFTNYGSLLVPQTPQTFVYDADGNLLSDGLWTNIWNAENRLVETKSLLSVPLEARKKEEWSYLPDGRWSERIVSVWNGSDYVPQYTNHFAWDGKVLVGILDLTNGLVMSFMRGLDLSGTIQKAGGAGGLLAINFQTNGTHFAVFDGNGNVAALLGAVSSAITANYDYGAFGETIRITGSAGILNPIRFSTQFSDDAVGGNLKFLHRLFSVSTGTWLSRDPLGELAFVQTQNKSSIAEIEKRWADAAAQPSYLFVKNDPESQIDYLGLDVTTFAWHATPLCGPNTLNGYIQVGLGGSSKLPSPFVDDGSTGSVSTKPNCPPFYPASSGDDFEDTPSVNYGFGYIPTTHGLNGLTFEVCHICIKHCCGIKNINVPGVGTIRQTFTGYKIVSVGPCMRYTLPGPGGTVQLNSPGIGTSSDGPSDAFNNTVDAYFTSALVGGCSKCGKPN